MSSVNDGLPIGLPKNYLRACLLLLVSEQPSHGYDLLERLDEVGVGKADPGGLYRALRAMEQEGLMRSVWQTSEIGPARRTYELTEEGSDWLHAWAATLRKTKKALSQYLSRYDRLFADALVSED
ncbi:MAG TPA: helix-turn-helix transcriptional regulator [Actinomycetota bacterium]|nr:helix-turn-helix transcriptional regulator [Actinomycetota bacterium]